MYNYNINMFYLILISSLFNVCFGITLFIADTPPIQFEINVPRNVTCIVLNAQPPITFQWTMIKSGSYYALNSNSSHVEISSNVPLTGYIICQAKGLNDDRFYNSTKVPFSANADVPVSEKQVYMTNPSPTGINFRVNRSELVKCIAHGFSDPIYYQWINVTDGAVLGNFTDPIVTFTFPHWMPNGAIRCQARGSGDSFYTSSKYVLYKVTEDVPLGKEVWIDPPWPLLTFEVNHPKNLTCKTIGFKNPILYKWLNTWTSGTINRTATYISTTPRHTFTFPHRVKNGSIQCLAQDSDATYTSSPLTSFDVNGQMTHKINTFFVAVMIVFALIFSGSQKII